MAWPAVAAAISGQRLRIMRNAGIFGNTTTQLLARVDSEVIAYKAEIVTIAGGTNDITEAYTSSATADSAWDINTSASNIRAIVGKLTAAGIQPVLTTIPPVNSSWENVRQAVEQWNSWIQTYGATQKLTVIDLYGATASTSQWKTGFSHDGTHPVGPGILAMGSAVWDKLKPELGDLAPESLNRTATDSSLGLVPNPGMQSWNASSQLPTGWVWDTPQGIALAQHVSESVGDTDGLKSWKLTRNAATTQAGASLVIPNLDRLAGKRVRVAVRVKSAVLVHSR